MSSGAPGFASETWEVLQPPVLASTHSRVSSEKQSQIPLLSTGDGKWKKLHFITVLTVLPVLASSVVPAKYVVSEVGGDTKK
jgi:hypothetical protein